MKDFVERVVRIQKDTEDIMKHAAGVLTDELGTKVLAIHEWGVQVADEKWVATQGDAHIEMRDPDGMFPYMVSCEKDGVTIFSIMNEKAYEELMELAAAAAETVNE